MDLGSGPHLVEIVAALKDITARISAATSVGEAIDDLLKVTSDLLPPDMLAGAALVGEGEPATFTANGLAVEVLDEVRHAGSDGPCMEAVRTRDIVVSQDPSSETRWPIWSAT